MTIERVFLVGLVFGVFALAVALYEFGGLARGF